LPVDWLYELWVIISGISRFITYVPFFHFASWIRKKEVKEVIDRIAFGGVKELEEVYET
jgi:hypothetical protein